MTAALIAVFLLTFAVAYVNGANDVSKGIATLVGSGVSDYRGALIWGTLWTGAGAFAGALLARAMIQTFGHGLLGSGVTSTFEAALATIAGAALWVALASYKGLPVSTTHAIVGSIGGVAAMAYGVGGVNWSAFGMKIFLPLFLSPLLSLIATTLVLRAWHALAPNSSADCLCVRVAQSPAMVATNGVLVGTAGLLPQVHLATCTASRAETGAFKIDHLHWFTSGATSMARGANDAPKMVAIALGAAVLTGSGMQAAPLYFGIVALGMLAGGWMGGRRVTHVLANKVTPMNHREGFVANLITAAMVGPGAALGLPMSTTHVASGAIMGVAATQDAGAHQKTVREMLFAWVITVPVAALFGVTALFLLRALGIQ